MPESQDRQDRQGRPQPPEGAQRRPYVPPAVEETGSFERLTLACSHLPTGPGNCHPMSVRS